MLAASDRHHCAVDRVRNLLAKLPERERERERVRQSYWQALNDATGERDGRQRLQALVDELDRAGYTAAAKCVTDDLDARMTPACVGDAGVGSGRPRGAGSRLAGPGVLIHGRSDLSAPLEQPWLISRTGQLIVVDEGRVGRPR